MYAIFFFNLSSSNFVINIKKKNYYFFNTSFNVNEEYVFKIILKNHLILMDSYTSWKYLIAWSSKKFITTKEIDV